MTRTAQAYNIHPAMTCIVRAYNIHPTAGGPFIDPVREENSRFLISFKCLEEAKLRCTNLLKYHNFYNLYYRITDSATDSWYAGHTDTNGVKQLKDLSAIPVILEDIIFEDDPITSNHNNNHDMDALTKDVSPFEVKIDLLTKEIRDLRDTKTAVETTVNNEVSAKHTNNMTPSSPIESGDDSRPPDWIEPPDGWEWIGAKEEYEEQMTGIKICYITICNEWGVFFPWNEWGVFSSPNSTKTKDFIAKNLSDAFEKARDLNK
jgi:hypothetical protein